MMMCSQQEPCVLNMSFKLVPQLYSERNIFSYEFYFLQMLIFNIYFAICVLAFPFLLYPNPYDVPKVTFKVKMSWNSPTSDLCEIELKK